VASFGKLVTKAGRLDWLVAQNAAWAVDNKPAQLTTKECQTMNHEDLTRHLIALERRVENLESAQAIATLHHKYIRDLAARDWQAVASAYTEDAVCDIRHHGVHRGRDAIGAMFTKELIPVVHSNDGYILSSPDIVVDGDTGRATWTWHRLQADFKTSLGMLRVWGPWSEGRYETEYVRQDGEWKISKLWFRVHAPDPDEEMVEIGIAGGVIGGGTRRI
jgi:ketosteroid isomerase-like protein